MFFHIKKHVGVFADKLRAAFILMLIPLMAACTSDEPGEAENPEGNEQIEQVEPNPSPTFVVDEASMRFVGRWNGPAPYAPGGVSGYAMVERGWWEFRNDGTFECHGENGYGYSTNGSGTWRYNTEKNWLITTGGFDIIWTIEDFAPDGKSFIGSSGGLYTYKKVDTAITPGIIEPANFHEGGLDLWLIIPNYTLIDSPHVKIGVCYSSSSNLDFTQDSKVFCLTQEYLNNHPAYIQLFNISDKEKVGVCHISVQNLSPDQYYYFAGFIDYGDGMVNMGKPYRIKAITPPANTVYMGEKNNTEYYHFWAKGWISNDMQIVGFDVAENLLFGESPETIQPQLQDWCLPTGEELNNLLGCVAIQRDSYYNIFNYDPDRVFQETNKVKVLFKSYYNENELGTIQMTQFFDFDNRTYKWGSRSILVQRPSIQGDKRISYQFTIWNLEGPIDASIKGDSRGGTILAYKKIHK